jgi:hypothetical protein
MRNLTYRDLLRGLQNMDESQLDMNVSIADVSQEEVYPLIGAGNVGDDGFILDEDEETQSTDFSEFSGILDDLHPILVIRT